jgi:hypothetical protein
VLWLLLEPDHFLPILPFSVNVTSMLYSRLIWLSNRLKTFLYIGEDHETYIFFGHLVDDPFSDILENVQIFWIDEHRKCRSVNARLMKCLVMLQVKYSCRPWTFDFTCTSYAFMLIT